MGCLWLLVLPLVAWLGETVWNGIAPDFGSHVVTYWQALGVAILLWLVGGLLRRWE